MFIVNFACKSFIFTPLSSSFFNMLIGARYSFTTNRVDKSEYIQYRFPKHVEDIEQQKFDSSFTIIPDIVSVDEEQQLIDEIEKSLKRLRYQEDHWDDAIHGYRETEMSIWKNPNNAKLIQNLKHKTFSDVSTTECMDRVHVLDLSKHGYVKPHIDSGRFCGNIIAGLSLLSDSVMRLAHENHSDTHVVYVLLPRRSLYIMKDDVRYQYTHEILHDVPSVFSDRQVNRQRRVSIVMRNQPL